MAACGGGTGSRDTCSGAGDQREGRPNCSLQAGHLLAPSSISQGQGDGISHICPRSSHAAEPEQLSVPCQAPMCPALALALDGTIG